MQKLTFNAKMGKAYAPYQIQSNPKDWTYVHRYLAKWKIYSYKLVLNRTYINVPSESPAPPSEAEVLQVAETQIQQQLTAGSMWYGVKSPNIIDVEYKETTAVKKERSEW